MQLQTYSDPSPVTSRVEMILQQLGVTECIRSRSRAASEINESGGCCRGKHLRIVPMQVCLYQWAWIVIWASYG